MSWIGGKKALRELIDTLFPVYYERYIEVFGGGGWVLFHKPPGNDFEVYNDFNGLLVNYDLRERSRMVPSQMTLFDWNGGETIG